MARYEYCEIDYEIVKGGWLKYHYIWVARRSNGEVMMRYQPHSKVEERVEDPQKPPMRATQIGLAMPLDQYGWQKIEPSGEHWYS